MGFPKATSGRNVRYNGKQGEVQSQLRVSQSMVGEAMAFYPPDVLYANLAKRYYIVSLPEHDITICGNDLKLIERAPVAP
jgi:hypothetical protein